MPGGSARVGSTHHGRTAVWGVEVLKLLEAGTKGVKVAVKSGEHTTYDTNMNDLQIIKKETHCTQLASKSTGCLHVFKDCPSSQESVAEDAALLTVSKLGMVVTVDALMNKTPALRFVKSELKKIYIMEVFDNWIVVSGFKAKLESKIAALYNPMTEAFKAANARCEERRQLVAKISAGDVASIVPSAGVPPPPQTPNGFVSEATLVAAFNANAEQSKAMASMSADFKAVSDNDRKKAESKDQAFIVASENDLKKAESKDKAFIAAAESKDKVFSAANADAHNTIRFMAGQLSAQKPPPQSDQKAAPQSARKAAQPQKRKLDDVNFHHDSKEDENNN